MKNGGHCELQKLYNCQKYLFAIQFKKVRVYLLKHKISEN